jgi:hypothetical protein
MAGDVWGRGVERRGLRGQGPRTAIRATRRPMRPKPLMPMGTAMRTSLARAACTGAEKREPANEVVKAAAVEAQTAKSVD